MTKASANRMSVSIFQVMKLVVFVAVAFASISPMIQLWNAGDVPGRNETVLIALVIFGAVLIPIEWIGLSMLLVRRGRWRDMLVVELLLASVLVALAAACWMFLIQFRRAISLVVIHPYLLMGIAINSVGVLILAGGSVVLFRKLVSVKGGS